MIFFLFKLMETSEQDLPQRKSVSPTTLTRGMGYMNYELI